MSTITLPVGASNYFTADGKYTGSVDLASDALRQAGGSVSYGESGAWHVVATVNYPGLGNVEGEPKASRQDAFISALEAAYAKATAPAPVAAVTPEAPQDEADAHADRLLSSADISTQEGLVYVAKVAVSVLNKVVAAAERL